MIVDQPGGNRSDEARFLHDCLQILQTGTTYVKPTSIAINVLSASSSLVRLIQLADVITSCTTAMVSGETPYSPVIFQHVKKLLFSNQGRIGGYGLKIHPDFRYINLYHWLLQDSEFPPESRPLPWADRPYYADPLIP